MRLLGKTCFLRKACSVLTSYSFRKKKLKPIPFVLQYRLYCFLSFFNYYFLVVITVTMWFVQGLIRLRLGVKTALNCSSKGSALSIQGLAGKVQGVEKKRRAWQHRGHTFCSSSNINQNNFAPLLPGQNFEDLPLFSYKQKEKLDVGHEWFFSYPCSRAVP